MEEMWSFKQLEETGVFKWKKMRNFKNGKIWGVLKMEQNWEL